MSDEHATVLYKGHRYQRRITKGAPCESCTFKGNRCSCSCTRPIVQEFGGCSAGHYIWVEVDDQGNELKPSTLTDDKGRVTNIKTGVRYTVVYDDVCGHTYVQTGMYKPGSGDDYIMMHNTCIFCNVGITIGLDSNKAINKNLRIRAVYTDEEFSERIGVSL